MKLRFFFTLQSTKLAQNFSQGKHKIEKWQMFRETSEMIKCGWKVSFTFLSFPFFFVVGTAFREIVEENSCRFRSCFYVFPFEKFHRKFVCFTSRIFICRCLRGRKLFLQNLYHSINITFTYVNHFPWNILKVLSVTLSSRAENKCSSIFYLSVVQKRGVWDVLLAQ